MGNLLGLALWLCGSVSKAKKEVFSNRYITPLYFHNPSKRVFEKCVTWLLNNGYTIISLKKLLDILDRKVAWKKGMVWISFDDGWKDNIQNVIPVIRKYNIPATFFISTDPIGNSGYFWWKYAAENREYLPELYRKDLGLLFHIEEHERKRIISALCNEHANQMKRHAMSIDDIKAISSIPLIDIGSHTVHHVNTSKCSDDELKYEISRSKKDIEKWIGKPIIAFAYPHGCFSSCEKAILKKNGYCLVATTHKWFITKNTDLFYIPRFSVTDYCSCSEAVCRMVGIWPLINKLKAKLR